MTKPLHSSFDDQASAAQSGPPEKRAAVAYRPRRRAACALEYCLVISLVAVVLIAGAQHFGAGIVNTFDKLSASPSGDAGNPNADGDDEGDGQQPGGDGQQPGGDGRPGGPRPGRGRGGEGRGRR